MALSKQQKYIVFGVFVVFVAVLMLWQLLVIYLRIETAPVVSEARDSDEMVAGYSEIKSDATQNDVIGIMGSQFTVLKCPQGADPSCAHIWHYEAGGQAWEFTFNMDGTLMGKQIVAAGQ